MPKTARRGSAALAAVLTLAAGPAEAFCRPQAPPAPGPVRRLSDADLLRFAATSFDKRKMMFRRQVVGRHRGTLVVADHPCGDVCPTYTRRIIHYDVDVSACGRVGGVVADEFVPRGPAVMRKPYCKPAVLVRSAPDR
jgi:hypothetical protein